MSIIIYGRNAVRATLEVNRVNKLYALRHYDADELVVLAREKKVDVQFVDEDELTKMATSPSHQGFAAICQDYETCSLDDIISGAHEKKYPLVIMLDGIEDPHNLGAVLRVADAFGADGVVIKNRNEVPLNATVAKVSTGAINYVKVASVVNLNQAIAIFKKAGYWIVASDGAGTTDYDKVDYRSPIVLIVGSEGQGIAPLVLRNSDFVVKIPLFGHVNSLNASVASGVIVSEIVLSRASKTK